MSAVTKMLSAISTPPFNFFVVLSVLLNRCLSLKIQCYCNLPSCGPRNLCLTDDSQGACFSDFLDYRQISQARQGCLHLLPQPKQDQCGNAPGSTGAPRSLLLCCQVNMCNQLTHSIIESFMNATEREVFFGVDESNNSARSPLSDYSTHEVWFKAATIAVPICGAMILVMLVALACKILRSDNVTVDKFCHGASNAAVEMKQYSISHTQDAANKVPLLYDTRHNCEEFRSTTSARIHYGQNVNVLKEPTGKPDKNVNIEYARVSEAVTGDEPRLSADTNQTSSDTTGLDVRVDVSVEPVPSFSVNLEKSDNVDSCNLFTSPRQSDSTLNVDKCVKYGVTHIV